MEILLNGKPHDIPDGSSAQSLIDQLGLGGRRLAMEVNGEILPRSQHAEHRLQAGDKIEIVHAIGGG